MLELFQSYELTRYRGGLEWEKEIIPQESKLGFILNVRELSNCIYLIWRYKFSTATHSDPENWCTAVRLYKSQVWIICAVSSSGLASGIGGKEKRPGRRCATASFGCVARGGAGGRVAGGARTRCSWFMQSQ